VKKWHTRNLLLLHKAQCKWRNADQTQSQVGGLATNQDQAVGKVDNSGDVYHYIVTIPYYEIRVMYYQIKSNIIFRKYSKFGYITDNRNYSYTRIWDSDLVIGDKIVSETGALFLSVLSQQPKEISEIITQIMEIVPDVEYDVIRFDAISFFNLLEKDGFLVSGETSNECKHNNSSACKLISEISKTSRSNSKPDDKLDTQDFFKEYFDDKPLLRSIHMEITSICNERCLHCYIPHENKDHHMDFDLFNKIVDESIEMKVLNFTISGGEPMLHPNFLEMIKRCTRENISLNILSNLTQLSDDIVNTFKANPLISVQASLDSIDPNVHDDITKKKGSFSLTKNAIMRLVNDGVSLQISCPILKQNVHCYRDVIEWAKTMNLNVLSDYNLLGMYNSNTKNLQYRLDYNDVSYILNNLSAIEIKELEKEVEEKKLATINDAVCSVCRYSFCVSELGNVYPCVGWQSKSLGNLYKSTLHDLWFMSEKTKTLRNLKVKDFESCSNCGDRIYCSVCMARNANENESHDSMKVSKYHCNIAKLKGEILQRKRI
jgi:radical SAM protein with 4Fe4S-binding SPASM domain